MENRHIINRFSATSARRLGGRLARDEQGAVLVEAAFALPIIIVLLFGVISYGTWFMAAQSVQQAANEGARAALAGIDEADRQDIVQDMVNDGVLSAGTVNADKVTVSTSLEGDVYTVAVSYDYSESVLLSASIIPLPASPITRQARVRLNSL
ncbi:TadE/TadG family type IV pilus assembly protein [Aurantiacibacter zhengii]|uniref:Pilus assembly protein n=1 Tax=Aurantiacibacter zhengii TaxID=2307003 RepID=A0A418NX63_9SPHN|nr:TadE/TadG family type IV pilus assembly protein [Aurantiacibacter zhengii]RIV89221.1 pilus assembly protein [Aurantiacibacter zhengii]